MTTLLERATFADGWDGFKNYGDGPPLYVSRGRDADGRTYARYTFAPNPNGDIGAQLAYVFDRGYDRLSVSYAFRLSAPITSIWKFCRTRKRDFSTMFGGLFVGTATRILTWGFDNEDSARAFPIGLTAPGVLDGQFHTIAYDYWRNGDPTGCPSVAFTFDGQPLVGPSAGPDAPVGPAFWTADGRLNAGERRDAQRIGLIMLLATLNKGNTTSGTCDVTDISISAT